MIQVSYGIEQQEARVTKEAGDTQLMSLSDRNMYRLEIADFAGRLRAGQPPRITGEHGKAALRVALAALKSIETGQPVKL